MTDNEPKNVPYTTPPPYTVALTHYPGPDDWMECKRRALVTVGKHPKHPPDQDWKQQILRARHSPIRWLMFSFDLTLPYWVSVHLARHVHAQPYIRSQRQNPSRGAARQDEPVEMIFDVNAEELMVIAEKRLCNKADPLTRALVREMCRKVEVECPEFTGLLGPVCCTMGHCREMHPCNQQKPMCDDCKHCLWNYLDGAWCAVTDEDTDPCGTCAFWEEKHKLAAPAEAPI